MNIKIEDEIAERLSEVMVAAGFEGNSVEEFLNAELLKVVATVRTDIHEEARRVIGGVVTISKIGQHHINAIKIVRQYTDKGLKEAKDIVDGVRNGTKFHIESKLLRDRVWVNNGVPGNGYWQNGESENAAADFVRDLRDIGCEVSGGGPDPRDIVAFRKKYGMIGTEMLKELMK